jgi:hypothetical protein
MNVLKHAEICQIQGQNNRLKHKPSVRGGGFGS